MIRNLLFITTDQQRFDSLRSYGFKSAITPNLDRLCREGVVFENCYVPAPICVACRSALMTGLYPSVTGTLGNSGWLEEYIPVWPRAASMNSYKTAGIGKMHFAPWNTLSGFDERIICEDKRHYYIPDDHYLHLRDNGLKRLCPISFPNYYESCGAPFYPYSKEYYPDSFIADKTVEWLSRNSTSPFAIWVSFIGPHDPYDPPEEFKEMYSLSDMPEPIPAPADATGMTAFNLCNEKRPGKDQSVYQLDYMSANNEQRKYWRKNYMTNLSIIDEGIGRIFKYLDDHALWENTDIVFTSDHGDALGDHGMVFKSFFYESMVHVPLVVKGPKVPSGERRSNLITSCDIVDYFLELLNIKAFEVCQGNSLGNAIRNPGVLLHDAVFSEMGGRYMVYDGRYKLCYYIGHPAELYDLQEDPNEMENRITDSALAGERRRLMELLLCHMDECNEKRRLLSKKTACDIRLEIERNYENGQCILDLV